MMINLFKKIVYHPKANVMIIIIGLFLVSPSLFSGFFADDFSQYVLVNEPNILHQTPRPDLFHLFSFFDNNPVKRQEQYSQSLIPWWSSSTFTLNFWRPIAELSHYVDYHWLKDFPIIMHLHSLIWYGLLLVLAAQFYQNFISEKWLAAAALLFFATDANHGLTVAWLANRNAVMAAVFTLFAFNQHHAFRQDGLLWRLGVSLFALTIGFFSAEIAVSIGCFYFAYALFLDKSGYLKGMLWLMPALIIFLVWFMAYHHFGFGVAGNKAYYINPITSPDAFFQRFLGRYPTAFSIQFNLLPLHLTNMFKLPLAILGCSLIIGLWSLAFRKKNKIFNFFLLIMCLAILPITTAAMQERNFLFIGLAGAGILAKIIEWLLEYSNNQGQTKLCNYLVIIILVFHVVVSGLIMLPKSFAPYLFSQESIATAKSLPSSLEKLQIVSFGVPFFDACYFSAIRKVKNLSIPERFWNILTTTNGVSVLRLDNHRLQISHDQGLLKQDDFLVRDIASEPFYKDQQLVLDAAKILIKQVNAEGNPTVIEWQFVKNLDSAAIMLVYWEERKLKPFTLKNNETKVFL